jgi:tRNA(Ile)-lysidine synthase
MLLEFEKKLARFAQANELFGSAEKVLLAVSGGADSTALLYAMHALKAAKVFDAELLCAHIHHQLRGADADRDEEFVIAQAAGLNLIVTTRRLDVRRHARENKLSIETAARDLRIGALTDIARAGRCDRIAMAHQRNDNAETILHRLSRGTGFQGLGGIWPVRTFSDGTIFVRPLLCVSRDEIIAYLQQRNLTWRLDHTNADCTYRRNYIRHRLLPALQRDCANSLVDQLSELARCARGVARIVNHRADELWSSVAECTSERATLNLEVFRTFPLFVKVELIRRSLTHIGCGQRDLARQHYERILHLAGCNAGGVKIELPGGFVAQREYGNLIFARLEGEVCLDERAVECVELKIPGQTKFGSYVIEAGVSDAGDSCERSQIANRKSKFPASGGAECFDWEKVTPPVSVRFRRAGDRFIPLGLSAGKKLGKFLTGQRVPQRIRAKVLVVADAEKILWVWPIRISEQAKVTTQTVRVLQLRITGLDVEERATEIS